MKEKKTDAKVLLGRSMATVLGLYQELKDEEKRNITGGCYPNGTLCTNFNIGCDYSAFCPIE